MSRLLVKYANGEPRSRSVQRTVCPTKSELGQVTNYNAWNIYITMESSKYHSETPLNEAKLILEALNIINQTQPL